MNSEKPNSLLDTLSFTKLHWFLLSILGILVVVLAFELFDFFRRPRVAVSQPIYLVEHLDCYGNVMTKCTTDNVSYLDSAVHMYNPETNSWTVWGGSFRVTPVVE